ncbi:MAG TPA: SLBB domain-containing protein [Acidobacteriaceae bacterium]
MALFLIAGVSLIEVPVAAAQFTDPGSTDCPSGIYSTVDGSCIAGDQSQQQPFDQQTQGISSPTGQGLSPEQLNQQYPGLQPQGMNTRIPGFTDQSGLSPTLAQRQALYDAQALALEARQPPTEFQQLVRATFSKLLPVYGDSLFRRVPSTFAPLRETPVTPDYVLGPGDQLVVRIWGQVNFNALVTVDRSGAVYLPQVGEIHVAGLPYSQVQDHLRQQVGRIYRNFDLSVEMGQLRSIQVFVVGQARRPGTYTISSLSTLVTALFATGGPSVQGSLRDIQIKRNEQVVTHFDLYDLLLRGDKSKDVPLLPGDVIYIPPVGPQVGIGGSVRNPAIYELKDTTSVGQALEFAGGISPTASVLRASIERIDEHKARSTTDITLDGTGLETPMRQGDILNVLPISPEFQNTVTLRGNVAVPGRFSWHTGMKLSEIIPDSKSLITRDYWDRRSQLGIPGPEFKPEYAYNPDYYLRNPDGTRRYPFNPNQNQINGTQTQNQNPNSNLNPNLYAVNPNTNSMPDNSQAASNTAPITGSDQEDPNAYRNCDPSATPDQTQQMQNLGFPNPANPANSQISQLGLPPCTPGIPSAVGAQGDSHARNLPRPPLNISLPVPEIDWSYAVIERFNPQTLTTSLVPFNLGQLVLNHDFSQDLALESGDVVTIFSQADISVPQAERTKFVRLEGEFNHAGIYSVQPGETLRRLVERAGGLTPNAYLFGSDFTRESTRVIQQQRLNDYLAHLEVEIDQATAIASSNSVTPQDATATQAELAASRSLVARFRLLRATGRVVLNIPPPASGLQNLPDIPLEDGDRFVIPSRPSTINIVGAVYNQNSFIFQQSRAVGGYLRLAGGPSQQADSRHSFVIRADGSVLSRDSQSGVFGNTFASAKLNPGDTVVIPEKVPKATVLRNLVNYTQIFSQLALGAASIAVIGR